MITLKGIMKHTDGPRLQPVFLMDLLTDQGRSSRIHFICDTTQVARKERRGFVRRRPPFYKGEFPTASLWNVHRRDMPFAMIVIWKGEGRLINSPLLCNFSVASLLCRKLWLIAQLHFIHSLFLHLFRNALSDAQGQGLNTSTTHCRSLALCADVPSS